MTSSRFEGVPFVFLMLEDNYHPDGWAGILMGTELHYPVSDAGDRELQPVLDRLSHDTMHMAGTMVQVNGGGVGAVGADPIITSGSAAAPMVTNGNGNGTDGGTRTVDSGSPATPGSTQPVPSGGMFEALLTQMVQQQGQTQHLLFSQQVSKLQAQVAAVQQQQQSQQQQQQSQQQQQHQLHQLHQQQQQQQLLLFAMLAVGVALLSRQKQ